MRRAFVDIRLENPNIEWTSNVHGAFGKQEDWPLIQPLVEAWLSSNRQIATEVTAILASGTQFENRVMELSSSVFDVLLQDLDKAIKSTGTPDISELLANKGLLPMFGFPTTVRNLYLKPPTRNYPWPPQNVISRELSIAVSQFAPGAESIRDGRVYRANGVIEFQPSSPSPRALSNPLGVALSMSLCSVCGFIEQVDMRDAQLCPNCKATSPHFKSFTMHQPLGFYSAESADYDGSFAWSSNAMRSRVIPEQSLPSFESGTGRVWGGIGTRYVINDNNGQQFSFVPSREFQFAGGYEALEGTFNYSESNNVITAAIGAVQPTDLMLYSSNRATDSKLGLRFNVDSVGKQRSGVSDLISGRRAAWYSLSFLIRKVASVCLDIDPQELEAGVFSGLGQDGKPTMFTFLADALENGAGFSSYLGTAEGFQELTLEIERFLSELERAEHRDTCDSSCYMCLRDYGNMAFHPLLDWRLARDLFQVIQTGEINVRSIQQEKVLNQWINDFHGKRLEFANELVALVEIEGKKVVICMKHELEASDKDLTASRLRAVEDAFEQLGEVVFVDAFTLKRDPRTIHQLVARR